MADVINWAGIGSGPVRVLVLGRDPGLATDCANGGTFLSALQEKLGTVAPVAPGDFFVNGIACSKEGAIRGLDLLDNAMLPDAQWIRGLPVTHDGRLIITSTEPIDHYVAGWPVAKNGAVVSGPIAAVATPGAFTLNAATQVGSDVVLTWTASTLVTTYQITKDGSDLTDVPAGTLTYTDVNPTLGAHTYGLVAENSSGNTASTPATRPIVVALQAPSSPVLNALTNFGNDVSITWGESLRATSYEVRRGATLIFTGGIGDRSCSDVNAPAGAQTYSLLAVNGAGSTASTPASRNITVPTVPAAPTAVAATSGSQTAQVTFTPGANGGDPIIDFTATASPGGAQVTGAASPLNFTGLTNGQAYTFTVTARNNVGNSAASAASAATTPSTVPDAPTGLVATAGDTQASVAFTPPVNNGGAAITSYTVTSAPEGHQASGAGSPIVVTGLTNDQQYVFSARAFNVRGGSAPSLQSNPVIPTTPSGVVPIFAVALQTTLLAEIATGPSTPTFARSTPAYVTDFEGLLRQAVINEARFQGARRVANTPTGAGSASEGNPCAVGGTTPPTASVVAYDGKSNATAITFPTGAASRADSLANTEGGVPKYATVPVADTTYTGSLWLALSRPLAGAEAIDILVTGSVLMGTVVSLNASRQPGATFTRMGGGLLSTTVAGGVGFYIYPTAALTAPITVYAWGLQIENVSGASNQAPGEYVPFGVPTTTQIIAGVPNAPYSGAGADGVQYFATENGNTVVNGFVTEATGAAIPDATLQGFLDETTATNLLLNSQNFNLSGWSLSAVTVVPGQIAPDGSSTGWTLAATATSADHYLFSIRSGPSTRVDSVYAKAGTASWLSIRSAGAGGPPAAWFDLTTGTIGTVVGGTAGMQSLGNGWYRCWLYAAPMEGFVIFGVNTADNQAANWTATGTENILIWGAQSEAGAIATSYISTTTDPVTRGADSLTYSTTGNFNDTAGTCFAELNIQDDPARTNSASNVVQYGSATPLAIRQSGPFVECYMYPNNNTAKACVLGALGKFAGSWEVGGNQKSYFNGVASPTVVCPQSVPAQPTMKIGAYNGTNRNVQIFDTVLSDAEIGTLPV